MLGNFSIGDYFRKEIVEWAFDILTNDKYFGMDKDKLYVTYHPTDLETRELWIKQGMNPEHEISGKLEKDHVGLTLRFSLIVAKNGIQNILELNF